MRLTDEEKKLRLIKKRADEKARKQAGRDPKKKGAADHLRKYAFGQPDGPTTGHGRGIGDRNKFSRNFISALQIDFDIHGPTVLADCRRRDPASYLKVCASIIPKELNINSDNAALEKWLETINDDELTKLISGLVAVGGASRTAERTAETSCQAGTGEKPDKLH